MECTSWAGAVEARQPQSAAPEAGVKVVRWPSRSPNSNCDAERWIKSLPNVKQPDRPIELSNLTIYVSNSGRSLSNFGRATSDAVRGGSEHV